MIHVCAMCCGCFWKTCAKTSARWKPGTAANTTLTCQRDPDKSFAKRVSPGYKLQMPPSLMAEVLCRNTFTLSHLRFRASLFSFAIRACLRERTTLHPYDGSCCVWERTHVPHLGRDGMSRAGSGARMLVACIQRAGSLLKEVSMRKQSVLAVFAASSYTRFMSCYAVQGAYRDDDGKPMVLQCVREAEKRVSGKKNMECVSSSPC
jgi:hypothetical protein